MIALYKCSWKYIQIIYSVVEVMISIRKSTCKIQLELQGWASKRDLHEPREHSIPINYNSETFAKLRGLYQQEVLFSNLESLTQVLMKRKIHNGKCQRIRLSMTRKPLNKLFRRAVQCRDQSVVGRLHERSHPNKVSMKKKRKRRGKEPEGRGIYTLRRSRDEQARSPSTNQK